MQLYGLLEPILAVISILAIILLMFILVERFRFSAGKEMFTDKFINYLESVHKRTATEGGEEADVREYYLSDKVKIMELSIHEQPGKKDRSETVRQ